MLTIPKHWCLKLPVLAALCAAAAVAADSPGTVRFGELPVPGATVRATQSDHTITALTDEAGSYNLSGLVDGIWTVRVEMSGFETVTREIAVPDSPPAAMQTWDLKMLSLQSMKAVPNPVAPAATPLPTPPSASRRSRTRATPAVAGVQPTFRRAEGTAAAGTGAATESDATPPNPNESASEAFAINGSVNNGAAVSFAQAGAFGNARRGRSSMYSGAAGVVVDNSALNANSYSLTGQATPKPAYNRAQTALSLGGPLTIPRLMTGPGASFFVGFQSARNRNATIQSVLVPTAEQRAGQGIAPSLLSPQSLALLRLYPLPNFAASSRYNYQVPLIGSTHQDSLQVRANKAINRSNQVSGDFGSQSTRSDSTSIFGFLDTTRSLGLNASAGWTRRYTARTFANLRFQFSRLSTTLTPFFSGRGDISGQAGIAGSSRDPRDWGPPTLEFASGIATLSSARQSVSHDQTGIVSYDFFWTRNPHNLNFGADFRRQQFNLISQQDPRGTFSFTGSDLSGFLRGIPDTAALALGNADKYLRSNGWDFYAKDDWRVNPGLTLNLGLRWEYSAPLTERYGRLVNLDISPGFAAIVPVPASSPRGSLTSRAYPDSLLRPDYSAIQPRIGFAWRPMTAGSLVVRGGYGLYYDSSVYQPIALRMVQQAPLSRSFSIQNNSASPFTLATALLSNAATPNTFAVDPDFRVGFNHTWQLSVQRDLPASLVFIGTYMGSRGARGRQQFLPNTFPAGAGPAGAGPAGVSGPAGFTYLASGGNSNRESAQVQLRRRLHKGFTSSIQYTWAKAIDNAALGGRGQSSAFIAQNWLDLPGERGLSNFDQRHLANFTAQYGTGMSIRNGWQGALLREWTATTQINTGTGLPLNPVFLRPTPGTGVTGSIRPSFTGAPLYDAPSGLYLNPAAFTAPAAGQWGNAGRNTIAGPGQFSLNASLARTFRLKDRINADFRIDATNALNNVTFPAWITVANSAQFGLPPAANPMRTLQTTFRVRF